MRRSRSIRTRPHLVAVIVGLAFAAACGSGSTGDGTPSSSRIEILDPDGRLAGLEATLRRTVTATLTAAAPLLDLRGVEITVAGDASRAIAGYGVGGFTSDGSHVRLDVDADATWSQDVLEQRLALVCTHELHHVRRFRGPGYGVTLLEALVSEGLADHFAVDVQAAAPPPWTDAYPEARDAEILDAARAELDSPGYDHARWFFGAGADLPRWAGYTLGYRLVSDYLARHPGTTAAGLVEVPAASFRPAA